MRTTLGRTGTLFFFFIFCAGMGCEESATTDTTSDLQVPVAEEPSEVEVEEETTEARDSGEETLNCAEGTVPVVIAGQTTCVEDSISEADEGEEGSESPEEETGGSSTVPSEEGGEEDSGEEDNGEEDNGEEDTGEENTGEEDTGEEGTGEEDTEEGGESTGTESENCLNGSDDDGDALADCQDPDCMGHPACGEDCSNGFDDDNNGLTDCEDPSCINNAACGEDCSNGFDDDDDGLVDCEDPNCEWTDACTIETCSSYYICLAELGSDCEMGIDCPFEVGDDNYIESVQICNQNDACSAQCKSTLSAVTQEDLTEYQGCIQTFCMNAETNEEYSDCIFTNCAEEYATCFFYGEESCAYYYWDCAPTCAQGDSDCTGKCADALSPEGYLSAVGWDDCRFGLSNLDGDNSADSNAAFYLASFFACQGESGDCLEGLLGDNAEVEVGTCADVAGCVLACEDPGDSDCVLACLDLVNVADSGEISDLFTCAISYCGTTEFALTPACLQEAFSSTWACGQESEACGVNEESSGDEEGDESFNEEWGDESSGDEEGDESFNEEWGDESPGDEEGGESSNEEWGDESSGDEEGDESSNEEWGDESSGDEEGGESSGDEEGGESSNEEWGDESFGDTEGDETGEESTTGPVSDSCLPYDYVVQILDDGEVVYEGSLETAVPSPLWVSLQGSSKGIQSAGAKWDNLEVREYTTNQLLHSDSFSGSGSWITASGFLGGSTTSGGTANHNSDWNYHTLLNPSFSTTKGLSIKVDTYWSSVTNNMSMILTKDYPSGCTGGNCSITTWVRAELSHDQYHTGNGPAVVRLVSPGNEETQNYSMPEPGEWHQFQVNLIPPCSAW